MYIVSKAQTGHADHYKSYLARGTQLAHIPDTPTFEALAELELTLYEPGDQAWNFLAAHSEIVGDDSPIIGGNKG